jgi:hypothetical protein
MTNTRRKMIYAFLLGAGLIALLKAALIATGSELAPNNLGGWIAIITMDCIAIGVLFGFFAGLIFGGTRRKIISGFLVGAGLLAFSNAAQIATGSQSVPAHLGGWIDLAVECALAGVLFGFLAGMIWGGLPKKDDTLKGAK